MVKKVLLITTILLLTMLWITHTPPMREKRTINESNVDSFIGVELDEDLEVIYDF